VIGTATKLLAKVAGPKVLIGVLIASTTAIAFLFSQWQEALNEKANAEQNARTYERALASTRSQLEREKDRRQALSQAITERRKREAEARQRAARAESRLSELEARNDEVSRWSSTAIPSDARDWLRDDS